MFYSYNFQPHICKGSYLQELLQSSDECVMSEFCYVKTTFDENWVKVRSISIYLMIEYFYYIFNSFRIFALNDCHTLGSPLICWISSSLQRSETPPSWSGCPHSEKLILIALLWSPLNPLPDHSFQISSWVAPDPQWKKPDSTDTFSQKVHI